MLHGTSPALGPCYRGRSCFSLLPMTFAVAQRQQNRYSASPSNQCCKDMTKLTITKIRLAVNGIFCSVMAPLCLLFGLPTVIGLWSGSLRFGTDPDGADKVLGALVFSAVLGTIALISLIRTVMAWRRLPKA